MIWDEVNKKNLLYLNSDQISLLFEYKEVNELNEFEDYRVYYSLENYKYYIENPVSTGNIYLDIYSLTEDPRILSRRISLKFSSSVGLQINDVKCKSVIQVNRELGTTNRIFDLSRYTIINERVKPTEVEEITTTTTGWIPTTSTTTSTTIAPYYIENIYSYEDYAKIFKDLMNVSKI